MGHNNGGGGSEHPNLQNDVTTSSIIDEDFPDNDKSVGSCSSSSSSSLCSYSNHFEVDIGEDDTQFLEFEDDLTSVVMNPESPSIISTLPQACDLNTLYDSPKQSPPIQVMGQPAGYDLNQIPSSMFGPKHRSNSDWSLASSESLFSIHTGNNSFSMDGGFFVSKSGELNWIDDHSCFTPDATKSSMSPSLPTVIDTSAENERKSASTNSESGEPIDSEREKGKSFANSANASRLSDASCQSTNSFAFPVLAGGSGSPSPTKVEAEKSQPTQSTPPAEVAQTTPKAPPTIPKAGGNQWFHCFSCFPMCC